MKICDFYKSVKREGVEDRKQYSLFLEKLDDYNWIVYETVAEVAEEGKRANKLRVTYPSNFKSALAVVRNRVVDNFAEDSRSVSELLNKLEAGVKELANSVETIIRGNPEISVHIKDVEIPPEPKKRGRKKITLVEKLK